METQPMTRLRAHFNGTQIVLDDPLPPNLSPDTPVEVVIANDRHQALRERQGFSQEFWSRPLPPGFQATGRSWKREDLYERRG